MISLENSKVIEEYVSSLYFHILKDIDENLNKNDFKIQSKRISPSLSKQKKEDILLVFITFLSTSEKNILHESISFTFEINSKFPIDPPIVLCTSNYLYPTLYDGRNILLSIINFKWSSNKSLLSIIESIPLFVNRTVYNQINKMNIQYGSYTIGQIYDINQIIKNNKNKFFKGFFNKNNLIYLIITEMFLLILVPIEKKNSHARLVLYNKITSIKMYKGKSLFEKMEALIGIDNSNFKLLKYLEINIEKQDKANIIIDILTSRSEIIEEDFIITHDDFIYKKIDFLEKNPNETYEISFFINKNMILEKTERINEKSNRYSSISNNDEIVITNNNCYTSNLNTISLEKSLEINKNSNKSMSNININKKIDFISENNHYFHNINYNVDEEDNHFEFNLHINNNHDIGNLQISKSQTLSKKDRIYIKKVLNLKTKVLFSFDSSDYIYYIKYIIYEIVYLYEFLISRDNDNSEFKIDFKKFIENELVRLYLSTS